METNDGQEKDVLGIDWQAVSLMSSRRSSLDSFRTVLMPSVFVLRRIWYRAAF